MLAETLYMGAKVVQAKQLIPKWYDVSSKFLEPLPSASSGIVTTTRGGAIEPHDPEKEALDAIGMHGHLHRVFLYRTQSPTMSLSGRIEELLRIWELSGSCGQDRMHYVQLVHKYRAFFLVYPADQTFASLFASLHLCSIQSRSLSPLFLSLFCLFPPLIHLPILSFA